MSSNTQRVGSSGAGASSGAAGSSGAARPDPLPPRASPRAVGRQTVCPAAFPSRQSGGRRRTVTLSGRGAGDRRCERPSPLLASARPSPRGTQVTSGRTRRSSAARTDGRARPRPSPHSACCWPSRRMLAVLATQPLTVSVPALVAVFLALVAAESIHLHFEFRRQTFSWSPSELALVIALVEVGGAWAALAWAVALAVVVLVQRYPAPEGASSTLAMACSRSAPPSPSCGCCRSATSPSPRTWLALPGRRPGGQRRWVRC